jgi:hypothetical protein
VGCWNSAASHDGNGVLSVGGSQPTHVTANLNTAQYGAFHYSGTETHIFMSMNEKCISPLHMK